MPISRNEIRNRAYAFVNEWRDETRERAEAQTFWNDFLAIFNVHRRRVASFEHNVSKLTGSTGYIDLFWPGTLLVEHKSKDEDLDAAYGQATGYFVGLSDAELPQYVLVSDFHEFRLFDMDAGGRIVASFRLVDLPANLESFAFISGYTTSEIKPEDPVNIEAAEKMGLLHDELRNAGYRDRALQVYLVRLLFCLFAEDTGIFSRNAFRDLILNFTNDDASDLGAILGQVFEVLNTPRDERLSNLAAHFDDFTYVNGALFEERLPTAGFDSGMRRLLLDATRLNWSKISPAIFGSLFQSVMDSDARRDLGAHYTSEANILKVIEPLFLDDLRVAFEQAKGNVRALERFHERLGDLEFLDPACGCGNFLVIAYRELRLLELEVLRAMHPDGTQVLDIASILRVDVDQFYGIEVEPFPAQIALVAMWLMDHQMNLAVSEAFGQYFVRLPLRATATIVNADALGIPWSEVVPVERLDYVFGNPPFVGKQHRSESQKDGMNRAFRGYAKAKILDFVTAWYAMAAEYTQGTAIRAAFVSTNSIAQGEQVAVLWGYLDDRYDLTIHFAHRTFKWTSQGRGSAGVHCVIIGFGHVEEKQKRLFEYETPTSDPAELRVKEINGYLVPAGKVLVRSRRDPICDVPRMSFGNMPNDGGSLLLTDDEKNALVASEPGAAAFVRPFMSAREFIHDVPRWCLWLVDADPADLRTLPEVLRRISAVRAGREASSRAATRELARYPTRFGEVRQPETRYVLIPRHSSEHRRYVPIGYMEPSEIVADSCLFFPHDDTYYFGILTSAMHMAWLRHVGGRIKSDYRYSASLVFNNFPFPEQPSPRQRDAVRDAVDDVLAARDQFPQASLADLYDPLSMPATLARAHRALDRAVDRCYRRQPFTTELNRTQFLFQRYRELAAPLLQSSA